MITYDNKEFYSTYEISSILKSNPDCEFTKLWTSIYGDYFRSNVQTVMDSARKNNVVKFLKFTTRPEGGKIRFVYNLEDVIEFLKKNIPLRNMKSSGGIFNVEYK